MLLKEPANQKMTGSIKKLVFSLLCIIASGSYLNAGEQKLAIDLPLQLSPSPGIRNELIIYVSGDGGWNSFNQQLVSELVNKGYGVVTLNSRKYFWSEKTPDSFARDFEQVSNYYMKEWKKSSLMIVGYSFGADVACFLPNLVSVELKNKIRKIALLSPSASTDFVIRLSDMVGEGENTGRKYQVEPEIEKSAMNTICIFGTDEAKILKNSLKRSNSLNIKEIPGDHRYQRNFTLLSQIICS